jgi:S-DNA-T family DNA segregation ATPase FtsK/SpoIIIE
MRFLGPTRFERLNEALAFVFLFAGLFVILSLVSYHSEDPSWNAVTSAGRAQNLTGVAGAHISDLCLQTLGFAAFSIPFLLWLLAWRWVRSKPIEDAGVKVCGAALLLLSVCTGLALLSRWHAVTTSFAAGGVLGTLLADYLLSELNLTGTMLVTAIAFIGSLYLISTFSMSRLGVWFGPLIRSIARIAAAWRRWRDERRRIAKEKARQRAEARAEARRAAKAAKKAAAITEAVEATPTASDAPPWEAEELPEPEEIEEEIPIRELEYAAPAAAAAPPKAEPETPPATQNKKVAEPERPHEYVLPPTDILNEVPDRNAYDSAELKEIAAKIKSKFEEFNVHGSVVQINPGPVVTTFELKPEAGVKYSRITTLTEDLCLGLQAESILIERIPGKPTVGIEVPNTRREVISLRQILESDEFRGSTSKMTICLGKDINGRIKVAALETMPHLLIAGSTGSGKSVMLNSMIMSILYKATPDEVRMILVDPKRVEMGIYEGIPHLLVPVITDAKKATNALRNAVLEMERRLKIMAAMGVRNIDQYNRKVRQMRNEPRALFEEDEQPMEDLTPLPYILILIDELADLMMLERGNVEEAVTRLAQMARAVGMHLVLATQRPSVDVITGLIKANFPARISFRVATRVDSRTVLDVMGAEHLLGKGDMLFLPPGSSRLVRVHGAFVTETETTRVVEFWKKQARPEYDQTFLLAPPAEEGEEEESTDTAFDGAEDPMYQDAVRVVLELGKASTSTLQRRLRLGYGRAARILDMMQKEGIIGPPDGSKPREVLKRPDWLEEVENQLR